MEKKIEGLKFYMAHSWTELGEWNTNENSQAETGQDWQIQIFHSIQKQADL